jgi:hypothetical protein
MSGADVARIYDFVCFFYIGCGVYSFPFTEKLRVHWKVGENGCKFICHPKAHNKQFLKAIPSKLNSFKRGAARERRSHAMQRSPTVRGCVLQISHPSTMCWRTPSLKRLVNLVNLMIHFQLTSRVPLNRSWQKLVFRSHDIHGVNKQPDLSLVRFAHSSYCNMGV